VAIRGSTGARFTTGTSNEAANQSEGVILRVFINLNLIHHVPQRRLFQGERARPSFASHRRRGFWRRRPPALGERFSRRRDSLVYSGRPLKTRPLAASVGASGLSFVFIVANAKPSVRPVSPNGEYNSTRFLCDGRRRISNKRSHLHEFIDQRQLMHSLSVLTSTQDGLRAVTGCG
jgi:hypothetical protein